jgi:hypothetical protein
METLARFVPSFVLRVLGRAFLIGVLMDENDPAGLSHCAQLDTRRYAQDERRPV